ncbi:hypothetical protein FQN54_000023 [Arachnomyces sp. PD_36]|nr:hypothetical protein FQN54_000023 [Arachnomyces sp. PD_36]
MAASNVPSATITEVATQQPKNNVSRDFGDFVSTEDEEADLHDVVEPWHRYDIKDDPRPLYPIYLGEVLNGRYLVEHKIGSGGFSAVWMAHDLQDKKDIALKVMSLRTKSAENELHMQSEILRKVSDTSRLVTYSTTFLLPRDGNEGQHRVLVYPLMGPCLDITMLMLRKLPMATLMSAAKQLLQALESLHKAGIVHRDLNDRNCMWGLTPLHNLSRDAKYKTLGRPLKQIIPFINLWKKGELVQPIEVPESLRTEKFYLGDFGAAMKLGTCDPFAPQLIYPPMEFCSPDRLHGKSASFACDMWSYMVIFAELYLGFPPFPDILKGGIISGIVKSLGPLPEQWKGTYSHPDALDYWYDQREKPDPELGLAAKIAHRRPEADPVERKHMLNIMYKVFTYDIEKRLTATQLLQDPSFRAIMDKYGC